MIAIPLSEIVSIYQQNEDFWARVYPPILYTPLLFFSSQRQLDYALNGILV